ncbi:hypothetical protein BU15DRAFT_43982 [Melanogaster broomeanus]|nr:hypothetical protein BU15DRAFT_43982 [Melanogaster broomeanus]
MASSLYYDPTVSDILRVRRYFTLIPYPLPNELVDDILDLASYWAHTSLTLKELRTVNQNNECMYMRTLPLGLPNTEGDFTLVAQERKSESPKNKSYDLQPWRTRAHPCRMIVFHLWSHDQGWSSWQYQETYRASWTWFNARVERSPLRWSSDLFSLSPDVLEDSAEAFRNVQFNVRTKKKTTYHAVTWHYLDSVTEGSPAAKEADALGQDWKALDGKVVNEMQRGDCIALWMRARYPGWQCTLEKAKITVYFAV